MKKLFYRTALLTALFCAVISCSSSSEEPPVEIDNNNNNSNNGDDNSSTAQSKIEIDFSSNYGKGVPNFDKRSMSFKVKNTGDKPFNITGVTLPNGFELRRSFSTTEVKPDSTKYINVSFIPTQEKEYSGEFVILNDADMGNNKGTIKGVGSWSVEDYDGNEYKLVVIGEQVWTKENFRGTHYANGDGIGQYRYYYSDELDKIHGKYYPRTALFDWHSYYDRPELKEDLIASFSPPTNEQWTKLFNTLGGKNVAGGKMKKNDTDLWDSPNTGATNSSGFSAIGSGAYFTSNNSIPLGGYTLFWSYKRTEFQVHDFAYAVQLSSDSEKALLQRRHTDAFFSIRLVRNRYY